MKLEQVIERFRELGANYPRAACELLLDRLPHSSTVELLDVTRDMVHELNGYCAGVQDMSRDRTDRQVALVEAVQDAIDAIDEIRSNIGRKAA